LSGLQEIGYDTDEILSCLAVRNAGARALVKEFTDEEFTDIGNGLKVKLDGNNLQIAKEVKKDVVISEYYIPPCIVNLLQHTEQEQLEQDEVYKKQLLQILYNIYASKQTKLIDSFKDEITFYDFMFVIQKIGKNLGYTAFYIAEEIKLYEKQMSDLLICSFDLVKQHCSSNCKFYNAVPTLEIKEIQVDEENNKEQAILIYRDKTQEKKVIVPGKFLQSRTAFREFIATLNLYFDNKLLATILLNQLQKTPSKIKNKYNELLDNIKQMFFETIIEESTNLATLIYVREGTTIDESYFMMKVSDFNKVIEKIAKDNRIKTSRNFFKDVKSKIGFEDATRKIHNINTRVVLLRIADIENEDVKELVLTKLKQTTKNEKLKKEIDDYLNQNNSKEEEFNPQKFDKSANSNNDATSDNKPDKDIIAFAEECNDRFDRAEEIIEFAKTAGYTKEELAILIRHYYELGAIESVEQYSEYLGVS